MNQAQTNATPEVHIGVPSDHLYGWELLPRAARLEHDEVLFQDEMVAEHFASGSSQQVLSIKRTCMDDVVCVCSISLDNSGL